MKLKVTKAETIVSKDGSVSFTQLTLTDMTDPTGADKVKVASAHSLETVQEAMAAPGGYSVDGRIVEISVPEYEFNGSKYSHKRAFAKLEQTVAEVQANELARIQRFNAKRANLAKTAVKPQGANA